MGQQSLGEETVDLVPIRGSKFRIPLIQLEQRFIARLHFPVANIRVSPNREPSTSNFGIHLSMNT